MIGSEEMSSTSMDITETFRPEDLSKTDFFDFVTAPDMGIGIGVNDRPPGSNDTNGTTDQPLQGYDQFWGSDKYPNRLDSAIFEDLDRYCWQQQQQQTQQQQQQPQQPQQQQQQQTQQSQQHQTTSNSSNGGTTLNQSSSIVSGIGNTDGQIYTLTVLNGTEPWIKRDPDAPIAPTLDLDSLLGSFPGYVKSEFVYEDSGFGTDGTKDDINQPAQHQQTQPSQGTGSVLPTRSIVTSNSTNLSQFQNNNNDWHMADHNATEQNSAESLLRSALQGKGYSKGVHIQNGFTIIPAANLVKDEELRRALFSTDQDSLAFADSTLSAPTIFDEPQGIVGSPTTQQPQTPQPSNTASTTNNGSNHSTATNQSTTTAGIIVDDMFLSLETAFSDDFERIKRIASEVQQFCTSTDYPEVIMEVTAGIPQTQTLQVQQATPQPQPPPPQPLQQEVTTSNPTPTSTVTKTTAKKYKRSISNNNNNNSTNNNNLNTNNNNNSPTQCNGQRKERSLHYCSICSKGFKDKYSVNVHIRTHTGEKPFACSLCGKSFRQKAHLAKHYQTHLAQKNGNVVKGGKQSQGQNRQSQSQSQQQPQPPPQPTTVQRQNSTSSNNSNPATLPPANGLMAGR